MRNRFIILFVLSGLLAASCGKEAPGEGLIVFRASTPAPSADIRTRASIVDGAALDSFGVVCTKEASGPSETHVWTATFTRGGDVYSGGMYWPASDQGFLFSASNAPIAFSPSGCLVSASASTDVVAAYLPDPVFRSYNELVFSHVFARLGEVEVVARDGYALSDVSVSVVPLVSGVYNVRLGDGMTDGTGWSETVAGGAVELAGASGGVKQNDIFLVPGQYVLTASWTASRGDFSKRFEGRTSAVSLVGGQVNRLRTSLGGDASDLQFTIEVSPWQDYSIDAMF